MSRDLRAAQGHVLEAGLVLAVGSHVQIAADLQVIDGERAVETGAGHAKVTIDFCAVQVRPFFEGNAVAQQITLSMQTLGGKIASDHRTIKPDQAVRMRVVQHNRAFDTADDDLDWPNELRVFKIGVPHNPGATDPNSGGRHRIPPRRPGQQILQKSGRNLAAVVVPVRIVLFLGVEPRVRSVGRSWPICPF